MQKIAVHLPSGPNKGKSRRFDKCIMTLKKKLVDALPEGNSQLLVKWEFGAGDFVSSAMRKNSSCKLF